MTTETLHNILLCIHLLGVFLLLLSISMLLVALVGLRRASTVEKMRAAMYAGPVGKKILPFAGTLILAAGIWLALLKDPDYNWHSAWIIFAFFTYLLMFANGTLNIGRRMGKVGYGLFTSKGSNITPKLKKLANDPLLHYPAWINVGLVFSFVVLMVMKPGWLGSLITILSGALAGSSACWIVEKLSKRQPVSAPQKKPAGV